MDIAGLMVVNLLVLVNLAIPSTANFPSSACCWWTSHQVHLVPHAWFLLRFTTGVPSFKGFITSWWCSLSNVIQRVCPVSIVIIRDQPFLYNHYGPVWTNHHRELRCPNHHPSNTDKLSDAARSKTLCLLRSGQWYVWHQVIGRHSRHTPRIIME